MNIDILTLLRGRDGLETITPKTETSALETKTKPRRDLSRPETRPRRDVAQFETSARRYQGHQL